MWNKINLIKSFLRYVDKKFCSCSCWDTVFKGSYESGIGSYKNFYFNATTSTMQIWLFTVIFIISLYESMKYLTKLIISHQIRLSMAVLFCLSLFPHYYAWWCYLNYLNDSFYSQWAHQTFFTVSIHNDHVTQSLKLNFPFHPHSWQKFSQPLSFSISPIKKIKLLPESKLKMIYENFTK